MRRKIYRNYKPIGILYNCQNAKNSNPSVGRTITKSDGKKWAMEEYSLSKNYYSFKINNWKFVVLDSIHARNTIPGYYGKIDDEQ